MNEMTENHDLRMREQEDDIDHSPVTYSDLTFETEVPVPSGLATAIQPPDLVHLGSPYKWSPSYKATITGVSCISTLFASFAASCYSPGATQMANEWHVSEVAVLVGITTFTCGFVIGLMFLAPFLEINGRKFVFVATAILFAVCQLCCSVCRSYPGCVEPLNDLLSIFIRHFADHTTLPQNVGCQILCWSRWLNIFNHGGRDCGRHLPGAQPKYAHGMFF